MPKLVRINTVPHNTDVIVRGKTFKVLRGMPTEAGFSDPEKDTARICYLCGDNAVIQAKPDALVEPIDG